MDSEPLEQAIGHAGALAAHGDSRVEHLPPVVAKSRARALITTPKYPRLAHFWSSLRLHDPHLQPRYQKLECIWMPFYHVTFCMDTQGTDSPLDTTVDAWAGSFAIVSFESPIENGLPPGEHFPPRMDPAEAKEVAYQQLLHTVMRQRSRGAKPIPREIVACQLLYWPFWVIYVQRKRRMDIRLLDAITAQPGGNRTKVGVLDAFTQAHGATKPP